MKSQNVETSKRQNLALSREGAETIRVQANVVLCGTISEQGTSDVLLVPDGYTKNANGVDWNIDDEAGRLIVAAFQAQGVALPIDLVHESHKEDINPKDLLGAVGWVENLHYEKGRGIIGKVSWNEEGKRRIRGGQFRYLSPVLHIQDDQNRRAVELLTVGLVNRPAIPHMERMAAEKTDKLAAGQRKDVSMMGDLTSIQEKLGLAADATVENIVSKIGELLTKVEATQNIVNAASKALALSTPAGESEIVVAINSHKQNATAADATKNELAALKDRLVSMEAQKLIDAALAANKINPNAKEDLAICTQLAKDKPERFLAWMAERKPFVEPGRTTPPEGGMKTGSGRDKELIANAVKAHNGNFGDAIIALQREIKGELLAEGLTSREANRRCAENRPEIFGKVA